MLHPLLPPYPSPKGEWCGALTKQNMLPASAVAPVVTYTPSTEDVQIYEVCVLYPYPMPQKEEQELLKDIEQIFGEAGAKLIYKDSWGRRGLAYRIRGSSEGNFVVFHYEMDPAKVKEVERSLRILKGMLRHLIVKPPRNYVIISYAQRYEEWLQERELEEERAQREKEERLKERVVTKALRPAKRIETPKPAPEKAVLQEKKLAEEIEKIITDADLNI